MTTRVGERSQCLLNTRPSDPCLPRSRPCLFHTQGLHAPVFLFRDRFILWSDSHPVFKSVLHSRGGLRSLGGVSVWARSNICVERAPDFAATLGFAKRAHLHRKEPVQGEMQRRGGRQRVVFRKVARRSRNGGSEELVFTSSPAILHGALGAATSDTITRLAQALLCSLPPSSLGKKGTCLSNHLRQSDGSPMRVVLLFFRRE